MPTKDECKPDSSVRPIEAPSGLDLHPRPRNTVRVSKRTTVAVVSLIALLLLGFAYGGYRRTLNQQAARREAGLPKTATPATQASNEIVQLIPAGSAPLARNAPSELQPPEETNRASVKVSCGSRSKNWTDLPIQSANWSTLRRTSARACRRAAERSRAKSSGCGNIRPSRDNAGRAAYDSSLPERARSYCGAHRRAGREHRKWQLQ